MTIWRSNSIFSVLPKRLELLSFLLLCFLIVLWNIGILDDWNLWSYAAFSLPFGSKTHLVCHRMFRTTSFQIQALGKTIDREEIFQHYFSNCLWIIFTMSLNIDMKMILPVKFSGSHCNSRSIWSYWGFPLYRILENLPLEFHKLSINSIQFAEVIIFSEYHWICFFQDLTGSFPIFPSRAQSQRRHRSWQWHVDKLGCAISLSIPTFNLGNWSGLCQRFLSDQWSAFLFPWKAVLLFSRDNSLQISN